MSEPMTTGARLRIARLAAGTSQDDLAVKMRTQGWDFHVTTVGKIERGERKLQLDEAVALAAILRTTVGVLAGTADDGDFRRGFNQALTEIGQATKDKQL